MGSVMIGSAAGGSVVVEVVVESCGAGKGVKKQQIMGEAAPVMDDEGTSLTVTSAEMDGGLFRESTGQNARRSLKN